MGIFCIVLFVVVIIGIQAHQWNDQSRQNEFYDLIMATIFEKGEAVDLHASYQNYFASKFWDRDFDKMIVVRK